MVYFQSLQYFQCWSHKVSSLFIQNGLQSVPILFSLQQIDMQIGEALAALNEAHKKAAEKRVAEDLKSPVE